jgi:hypothetical protein
MIFYTTVPHKHSTIKKKKIIHHLSHYRPTQTFSDLKQRKKKFIIFHTTVPHKYSVIKKKKKFIKENDALS